MRPIKFLGQNAELQAPPGVMRGQCEPLSILRGPDDSFGASGWRMDSYWTPTPEELALLNSGGQVRLCVHGFNHPMVWLDVRQVMEIL